MTSPARSSEALRELAPKGMIRVAVNVGNTATVSVSGDGTLGGPAAELADALGGWAGLPVTIIRFASAGEVVKAAEAGDAWDVAFLAADPARAGLFHFTPGYLKIEAKAAVWASSTFHAVEELDREGVRIASSEGAAYDLVLQRKLRYATRVTFGSPRLSFEGFDQQRLEAVAGISEMLEQAFQKRDDVRLLSGRIAEIEHAMALPVARERARAMLDSFVREHARPPATGETGAMNE